MTTGEAPRIEARVRLLDALEALRREAASQPTVEAEIASALARGHVAKALGAITIGGASPGSRLDRAKELVEQALASLESGPAASAFAEPAQMLASALALLQREPAIGASPVGRAKTLYSRTFDRMPLEIEVEFGQEDSWRRGRLEDLSEGGLFVATTEPFAAGTDVELRFMLPGSRIIQTRGHVRWIRLLEHPTRGLSRGMGIEIAFSQTLDLEPLRDLLRERDRG